MLFFIKTILPLQLQLFNKYSFKIARQDAQNCNFLINFQKKVSFGGRKESGIGKELEEDGLRNYLVFDSSLFFILL